MAKIKVKQTLAFENKLLRTGDTTTLNSHDAKELVKNGLAEMVDENDETEEPASKNSVTVSDEKGKKVYDSGTTDEHIKAEKAKPSNVSEVKKNKDVKEK